jgi:hypothetical protein
VITNVLGPVVALVPYNTHEVSEAVTVISAGPMWPGVLDEVSLAAQLASIRATVPTSNGMFDFTAGL